MQPKCIVRNITHAEKLGFTSMDQWIYFHLKTSFSTPETSQQLLYHLQRKGQRLTQAFTITHVLSVSHLGAPQARWPKCQKISKVMLQIPHTHESVDYSLNSHNVCEHSVLVRSLTHCSHAKSVQWGKTDKVTHMLMHVAFLCCN